MKKLIGIFVLLAGLLSCSIDRTTSGTSAVSYLSQLNTTHIIRPDSIRQHIREYILQSEDHTAWDSVITAYYSEDNPFLWLNTDGRRQVDTLLYRLDSARRHGLDAGIFFRATLEKEMANVRLLTFEEGKTINHSLATLEYRLTRAYLHYICGLRYGFIQPHELLNNLEVDDDIKYVDVLINGKRKMKTLYQIPLKACSREYAQQAFDELRAARAPEALRHAQPASTFYLRMQKEMDKWMAFSDTVPDTVSYYIDRVRVNLERERWQYHLDKGKKYVFVNTAAFMLKAVNEETDSILEMRICCGTARNKTPLLSSKISYIELNPYWNVPQNIIKKEIIPAYRRDTTYFTKNRMKVYDDDGNLVNPHDIQWSNYARGVPFSVKQDNKEGNSLGRIIFRFPNSFAVYLHDTPMRSPFLKANRAVSHGCVRLEKALDFAFFLLDKPNPVLEDRIRVAMSLKAQSAEGKRFTQKEGYEDLEFYNLKAQIPVFLDYQTMYLSVDGVLSYCEDTYKYDQVLLAAFERLSKAGE